MRLFVALNFDENIKNALLADIDSLQKYSLEGNFTKKDNLHLTIAFIGETPKINEAKAALQTVREQSFALEIAGFGCFRRRGGDLYWRGVKSNERLLSVYRQVTAALRAKGFVLDDRPFKPHLTLGRQVITDSDFDMNSFKKTLLPLKAVITRVSLMKSERIQGKLCYSEVCGVDLP